MREQSRASLIGNVGTDKRCVHSDGSCNCIKNTNSITINLKI